jgi:hypothetical protein
MPTNINLDFISRCVGVLAAALIIGVVIEFARSSGPLWSHSLLQACLVALMSYFAPVLWLKWRYRNEPAMAWLLVPTLGSVLLNLALIRIPNVIAVWNYSGDGTFIANFFEALPDQLIYFVVSSLALSLISGAIVGLALRISSCEDCEAPSMNELLSEVFCLATSATVSGEIAQTCLQT